MNENSLHLQSIVYKFLSAAFWPKCRVKPNNMHQGFASLFQSWFINENTGSGWIWISGPCESWKAEKRNNLCWGLRVQHDLVTAEITFGARSNFMFSTPCYFSRVEPWWYSNPIKYILLDWSHDLHLLAWWGLDCGWLHHSTQIFDPLLGHLLSNRVMQKLTSLV